MNCFSCYQEKQRTGAIPLCEKPKGCPIGDVAPDIEINELIKKFRIAKTLSGDGMGSFMYERMLNETGLADDSETLIELEIEYAKWRQKELKKQQKKQKRK